MNPSYRVFCQCTFSFTNDRKVELLKLSIWTQARLHIEPEGYQLHRSYPHFHYLYYPTELLIIYFVYVRQRTIKSYVYWRNQVIQRPVTMECDSKQSVVKDLEGKNFVFLDVLQNYEKLLLASPCLSGRPYVRTHEYFSKICWENWSITKTWQE